MHRVGVLAGSAVSLLLALGVASAASPAASSAQVQLPAGVDPVSLDLTGTDLVRPLGERVRLGTLERDSRRAFAAAAPTPVAGWTVTQVGDYVIIKDDGSHGCDNLSVATGQGFDTCVGGGNEIGGGNAGAIDAFYAAYPDANPQYLATWFAWDLGFAGAFYSPVASDTLGIGAKHFLGTDTMGDATGLNGWIFMNSLQLYSAYGPQEQELLFDLIWGQEFEHRWAAFVHFDDHGTDSKALLGRQSAHWSWFMNTNWSWMEGNAWTQDGSKFTTDFGSFQLGVSHKCPMDLYLMGLIPPSAVEDFMVITDGSAHHASDPPQILAGGKATITGKKKMVSIDDVIRAEGDRQPTWIDQPRSFKVANVIILRSSDDENDATMRATMQQFVDGEKAQFALETHGLAQVDTTLGAPVANVDPVAAFTLPETGKQGEPVALDASASSDTDGTVQGYAWDFGDGTGDFLSGKNPTHAFKKAGPLTVTLTVVDDLGGHATTTKTIDVAASPKKDGPFGCSCDLARESGTPVNPFAAIALALATGVGLFALRRRSIA